MESGKSSSRSKVKLQDLEARHILESGIYNSHNDLSKLQDDLSDLQQELMDIGEDFRATSSNKLHTHLALDFDVIRSAIDWNDSKHKGNVWASLLLNQNSFRFFLLPGTLYELITYMKSALKSIAKVAKSAIGNKFIELFQFEHQSPHLSYHEEYKVTLKSFVDCSINSKRYFLLKNLQEQSDPISIEESQNSSHIAFFRRAVRVLSSSEYRREKDRNNRVDSLNFALIKQFNRTNIGERCILISDTKAVHHLGGIWPEKYLSSKEQTFNTVWNSRKAAIYILLLRQESTLASAERSVWRMLQELVGRRAAISDALSSNKPWKIKQHGMLQALTSFHEIGTLIKKDFVDAENICVNDTTCYNIHRQKQFYTEFNKQLIDILNLDKGKDNLNLIPSPVSNMDLVEEGENEEFGYNRLLKFSIKNQIVCIVMEFEYRILFSVRSKAPLVEFVEAFNIVRSELSEQRANEKIDVPNIENQKFAVVTRDGNKFVKDCYDFYGQRRFNFKIL